MEADNCSDSTMNPEMMWRAQMLDWEKNPGQSCKESSSRKKPAPGYVEKNSIRHGQRVAAMLKDLELEPHFSILDIGAGAGTLTLPMAENVRQVTALDPSMTMFSVLTDYVTDQGIANISCIQGAWEDPEILDRLTPPYDVVVASLSLGMSDIKGAIKKMEAVACGDIVIYWHAGIPGWEKMPRALWPTLFKKDYHGGPKSDLLFFVLYEMGIYPRVEALPCRFEERFTSLREAVNNYAEKFCVTDSELFPVIEGYLKNVLSRKGDDLVYPIDHVVMKFQWRSGFRPGLG